MVVLQDLPGALDAAAVTEALNLHTIKNRQWSIFKTSAIKGDGLFEGLDWYYPEPLLMMPPFNPTSGLSAHLVGIYLSKACLLQIKLMVVLLWWFSRLSNTLKTGRK